MGESGGLFDRDDARMRDRRAYERHFEHCGTPYVADELTTACEEARILLAAERSADALA
jgi:hypothetical protein